MLGVPDRCIYSTVRHSRRFSSIEAVQFNMNDVNRISYFALYFFLEEIGVALATWPHPGYAPEKILPSLLLQSPIHI